MKRLESVKHVPIVGGMAKRALATLANNDARIVSGHFSRHLKPELARSEALKHEVYKLRHQVYCEELHFEDIKEDHEEQDEFDSRSRHCCIRHLASNHLAGTVRVVTSRGPDDPLPLEKFCADAISDIHHAPGRFPRDTICEISRLAVPAEFRKRAIDKFQGAATGAINERAYSATELRCFPYIAVSLYLAAALVAIHHGKNNAYAMMEPRLARSLAFVGIKFIQLGEAIPFHGRRRAAYYINAKMFRDNLPSGYGKLLKSIEREMFDLQDDRQSAQNPLLDF